jgi:hypothetical protein
MDDSEPEQEIEAAGAAAGGESGAASEVRMSILNC